MERQGGSISRRDLLKAGGALVVSFAFAAIPVPGASQTPAATGEGGKPLDLGEVDSFLAIHADGAVTVYTSKVDVGTGMRIAIAQMAAEELGVAAGRITIVDGDTALCPNQGGTGGSTGLTRGGTGVRRAAATARQRTARSWRRAAEPAGHGAHDRRRRGPAAQRRPRHRHRDARRRAAAVAQGRSQRAAGRSRQLHGSSASRFRGPMCRPSAPAGTSTSTTSACRACSTPGSSARRPSAQHFCPWTNRRSAGFPMSASCGSRAFSRCSRRTSGRPSAPRARSRRRGASGRGFRDTTRSSRTCATAPSTGINPSSIEATSMRRWPAPRRRSPQRISGRTRATRRSARRAPSPTCVTTARPSGPPRRPATACAERSRGCSASRPTRCGSSSSRDPDRTARTGPTTRPPTRCSSRRPCGSRCACSGRARTSSVGIRKARSSFSICAPASIRPGASSPGRHRCGSPRTCRARGPFLQRRPRGFRRMPAAMPPRSRKTAIRLTSPAAFASSRTGRKRRR